MSLFILLLTLMHLYHIQETHTIFIRQHEGDQNVHHKHTPILHSFNFMLSTTDVITIFDVSNKKSLIYKIIRKVCIISGLRESTSHCKAVLLQVRRTLVVIGGFPDNRNRREHLKLEGIACFGSAIVSTLQPNSSCRKPY